MSTHLPWRTAFASVIGSSHQKHGTVCQDAGSCRLVRSGKDEVLLAVVSDGAGSASKSDIGSNLTTNLFLQKFEKAIQQMDDFSSIDRPFVIRWLEQVRNEIAGCAEAEGLTTREFACTVLGALIGPKDAVFFQIGDGAIVVSHDDSREYSPMFWPQHGEFANQTNFIIQDNFADVLEFTYLHEQFDKVALFTDGLERLVLNFSSKTVHAPALASIFQWLAGIEPVYSDTDSPALLAYLGSDFINNRTDDDKTLVLATRSSLKEIAGSPPLS